MSQSNVIAGSIFIAFLVYVTTKGELPTYINLLKGNVTTTNSSGNNSASQNSNVITNATNAISGVTNLEKSIGAIESINITGNAPAVQ